MTVWSFVAAGAVAESASGDLALAEPAGVQANDLLVACISYRGNAAFTRPASWNQVAEENTGNDTTLSPIASGRMDYIVRGGSAPALTWTRTGGGVAQGRMIAWRRTDGGIPAFDQGSSNTLATTNTTGSTAGITTVEVDTLLVMAECSGNDTNAANARATDPPQADWTERTENLTATGNDVALAISTAIKDSIGATGTFQWTASGSSRSVTIVGAFRPKYTMRAAHGVFSLSGQIVTEPGVSATAVPFQGESIALDSDTLIVEDVPIGTAAADRVVVVHMYISLGDANATAARIGGITATFGSSEIIDLGGGAFFQATSIYAEVPTGTVVDVEVDVDQDTVNGYAFAVFGVHAVYGTDSPPVLVAGDAVLDTSQDGIASIALTGVTNGRAVCATIGEFYGAGQTTTWTNALEEYDTPVGPQVSSMASHWYAAAATDLAITSDDDAAPPGIAALKVLTGLSFAPAGAGAVLIAEAGDFDLNGQTAGSFRTRIVPFAHGSFTFTGQVAGTNIVNSAHGSFTLSGQIVALNRGFFGASEHGLFSLNGQAVSFIIPRIFPDPGLFVLTGGSVDLIAGQVFSVDHGLFSLIVQEATLNYAPHGEWNEEASDADTWTEQVSLSVTWTEEASLLNTWTEET
jgi:hypothetical protein